jgi:hypothetical protein
VLSEKIARKRAPKKQLNAANGQKKGPPSRLTPDLEATILLNVELGVPMRTAARAAGIPEGTFDSWMRKGREGRQPYSRFCMALTCARASGMVSLHIRAIGGGPGCGGAQWALERRFPEEYGLRQKLELSENPDARVGGIRAALDGMTTEQLRILAAGGKARKK